MGVVVKKFEQPRKKKWYLIPSILLLAALCIGGMELAMCSYFEPELYQRITAPVRNAVQAGVQHVTEAVQTGVRQVTETGEAVWNGLCLTADAASLRLRTAWEELTTEAESDEELQLVDDNSVTAAPRPPANYTITALESREELDILTGGALEVVYYDQTSERWAGESYGSDRIGSHGCGPTAMSIVVSTLAGQIVDPAEMARHCVEKGCWARLHGSYLNIVQTVAEDFGLVCSPLPPEEADSDTIVQHLASGSLIVALMGPGHFTNGGHFIVLRGVTLEGGILVADPASQERSLTVWDLDLILEELSVKRWDGSPLWVVSPQFT